jgi:hypothetical protein
VLQSQIDNKRGAEKWQGALWALLCALLPLGAWGQLSQRPTHPSSKDELEVSLSRVARITPDVSGEYEFFRVTAAPNDPLELMVCTLHLSAKTNEETAEIFGSADGGESWSLRLRDGSSHDVSEDACAFGEAGRAYFIAQPWNVKSPNAPHASIEQSEMHLYRSSNSGRDWPGLLTSEFVDYARIAVDTWPDSPFRGRAYLVGNRTASEEFPFFAVLEGGKRLTEAKQSAPLIHLGGTHGQYPRSLIVLRNGDVLASYDFVHDGGHSAVVTSTRDGGRTVDGPTTIEENICPQGMPSIAEDPVTESILAFYTRRDGPRCVLTISRSIDEGRTWRQLPVSLPGTLDLKSEAIAAPRSVTFRSDGIALLTWTANQAVRGAIFTRGWNLLWTGEISVRASNSGFNLAPYVRADDRLSGGVSADMDISLQFGYGSNSDADTATRADGSFEIVWSKADGQLYSRSIRVALLEAANTASTLPKQDVTPLVRYVATNITFDQNSNTFGFDLTLLNASDVPIKAPLVLRIKKVTTTIGSVTVDSPQENEIVFLTKLQSLLQPGEKTLPVCVRIRASSNASQAIMASSNHFPRVGLIGRVYAELPREHERSP